MFVTQLTKHDWYRIYKYLWKAQISPNRFRIFAKFGMVLLVLLAVYLLAPTILRVLILLLFRIPFTVSISYSGAFFIAIIVFLLIFYYPLLFWKELRIFSPKVFITLTKSTDHFKLKKIRKQYPTAYITAGLFSPSFDSDLIAISFKDCYLLVTKPLSINNLILYVRKKSITLKLHYFMKSKFHNTIQVLLYRPIRQCTYIRI